MGTILKIKTADFSTNAVKRIDPDEPVISWQNLALGTVNKNVGFIGTSSNRPQIQTDSYWGKIFAYTEPAAIPSGALQVRGAINNLILGTSESANGLPIIVFYDSSDNYISMTSNLTIVETTVANQSATTKNYGKKGQILVDVPTNAAKFRVQWVFGTDSGVGNLNTIKMDSVSLEYSTET